MTAAYRREHIKNVANDEFEALSQEGRDIIVQYSLEYEAAVSTPVTPAIGSGERTALRRAMARFVIDSGIASARGWI